MRKEKKLSYFKIAEIYGCNFTTIYEVDNVNKNKKLSSSEVWDRKDEIINLYEEQELSSRAIARKYNCSNTLITKILRKNNIKIRK